MSMKLEIAGASANHAPRRSQDGSLLGVGKAEAKGPPAKAMPRTAPFMEKDRQGGQGRSADPSASAMGKPGNRFPGKAGGT